MTNSGLKDHTYDDQLADARPYKLYVFFHTLELTPEKKALVENLVREKGAVAIFIWADFLMSSHGMDIAGMSETIGMDIAFTGDARHWKLKPEEWFLRQMNPSALYPLGDIDRFQHQGWQPGKPRPSDNFYAPTFKVVDTAARAIATYEGTTDVAIAVKPVGKGTSIYSAPATLSPSLLRYAGELAGCFRYIDTEDALFVNESFVFIHAGRSGNINLTLPEAGMLYEVFSGKEYPASARFTIPVGKDETYLFFRGSADEWQELGGRK